MKTIGRLQVARVLVASALTVWALGVSAQKPEWQQLEDEVRALASENKFEQALETAERAIRLAESGVGPEHPDVGWLLTMVAQQNRRLARPEAAERAARRALAIFEKAGEERGAARALHQLALVQNDSGDYEGSLRSDERALAILERIRPGGHATVADQLNNLGSTAYRLSRYDVAEQYWRRALEMRERVLPADAPDVAASLFNMALIDWLKGRLDEAQRGMSRALAIEEAQPAPNPLRVANTLATLAAVVQNRGQLSEAEAMHTRALALRLSAVGPRHPAVVESRINIGNLHVRQARFREAELSYLQAIDVLETSERPSTYLLSAAVINLSAAYLEQGRYADAVPLLERGLALSVGKFGEKHESVVRVRTNLGTAYRNAGRPDDALRELRAALATAEALGLRNDDETLKLLSQLGGALADAGRLEEAERLFTRALAASEASMGPQSPRTAEALAALGQLRSSQGRLDDAAEYLTRAAAIQCNVGTLHPTCADSLNRLSVVRERQSRLADALALARQATERIDLRRRNGTLASSAGQAAERRGSLDLLVRHVSLVERGADDGGRRIDESYRVMQLARASDTAAQVARMAARQAAGNDALAALARRRQDAERALAAVDKEIQDILSQASADTAGAKIGSARSRQQTLTEELGRIDSAIAADFPRYQELVDPSPLSTAEASRLLAADEALVSFLVGARESFSWIVTRTGTSFRRIDAGRKTLDELVRMLRRHLDPTDAATILATPFPVAQARRLFDLLLAPASKELRGIRHLIVVPDGPLQSLPLSVLVTDEPPPRGRDGAGTPWLIGRHALSVLPAESTLRALRILSSQPAASRQSGRVDRIFAGFGDPLLAGVPGTRGVTLRSAKPLGNVADAVRALPRLPETASELNAIASSLHAPRGSVHLREEATLAKVRSLDLDRYRILAFATHGLLAGELQGVAEPSLVLTPAAAGDAPDDGLLTASEISQLRLRSDWVVLSACNTAAGDGTPGAEGLSGLSKAFFYAGARALLVSHWSVESNASVALTTRMFQHYAQGRTKAAAHQAAALDLISHRAGRRDYSHPMFWAPFVVVGDGATTAAMTPVR